MFSEEVSEWVEKREALEKSILKWERILEGAGADYGGYNCALCQLYGGRYGNCSGCPVANRVGRVDCTGTPYKAWSKHQVTVHGSNYDRGFRIVSGCLDCTVLVCAELKFLRETLEEMRPEEDSE